MFTFMMTIVFRTVILINTDKKEDICVKKAQQWPSEQTGCRRLPAEGAIYDGVFTNYDGEIGL